MITGELRSKVDKIWDAFWSGGISNPLTVIEQITYLLFIKRLDELHTNKENKANMLNKEIEDPIFTETQGHLRWSKFKNLEAQEMYDTVSLEVFPFIKNLHGDKDSTYSHYMKDATFMIPTPNLLSRVVDMLSEIPMESRDTKGDLYEYLLSKIATAGQNGQFRTPRHIIRMMVDIMKPKPEDIICDPACGTCGFLVSAGDYLRDNHQELFLKSDKKAHFNNTMFYGNDFDATMLRIGAMNMLLHGIENPNIIGKDALSQMSSSVRDKYTLVLANPPFKGSLDYEAVAKDLLQTVKTKKTELLFLALFLKLLKVGGRCACIVPDGVLFGSSNAHVDIRKEIIDGHKLDAVISMPSGVFKPYAGVSTAILFFTKTNSGGTDKVWFYDMQADGFSLDDKRTPLDKDRHEENNIPDIIKKWENLEDEEKRKKSEQSFFVPVEEIRKNKYDLSINRYKEIVYEEIEYDPPKKIIADIKKLEDEIQQGLIELEGMLW
ncbi:SAM-dependent DNA methyltransferase [Candidatus Parcubacteria bacterium]|nr:MAG: SAM-dependent DNA methyltransferase [Candidatus Parcubacteria bacterium]